MPALAGLTVLVMAAAADPGQPASDAAGPPTELATLNRLLRRFDFEEAQLAPYTMPLKFYRYIAPDQGFPPFGKMLLTDAVAHEGRWSFEFDLNGGSLSARVPTAVLPVLPGSDYTVSAWIRTEGLVHAAARLAAQLHDAEGRAIPRSRADGPLMRSAGQWQHVSIVVHGDAADAADLVVELQVLQPRHFVPPDHAGDEPLLEDVKGRVWFDDVAVWRRPRIDLSTQSTGNVVTADERPALDALIHDPTPEALSARVRVFDVNGGIVHDGSWGLPQGAWKGVIQPADLDDGWYRAVLDVVNDRTIVGRQSLDFVTQRRGDRRGPAAQFGIVLPPLPAGDLTATIRQLTIEIGAGSVLIPVSEIATSEDGQMLRRVVEELVARGVEVTLALTGRTLPADDGPHGLDLLGYGPKRRHELLQVLMNVGLDVPRWRLGIPGVPEIAPPELLRRRLEIAAGALADYVPEPTILLPWSADYELSEVPAPHGYWIKIPYHVAPEAILDYASRWPVGSQPLHVTLERLPRTYAPDEALADLMLRALYGWRAGLPRLTIAAPWSADGPRGAIVPDPAFAAWSVLSDQLQGRAFGGRLSVAEGVECWMLDGPGPDAALVAWNDRAEAQAPQRTVRLQLAAGPVEVIDAFGNRLRVPASDGAHAITVGPLPIFITGVDGRLARFRSDLDIRPGLIAARQEAHECRLELRNPWEVSVSGTIRLRPPEGWRITPRIHAFTAGPGQRVDLPITVTFGRSTVTGPAVIQADIDLHADREFRFGAAIDVEVGLSNIEFAAHWRVAAGDDGSARDLIVTQHVTNAGTQTVTLSAYVSGPGISRQRQPIPGLEPGQTALRTFRLADGARLLSGRQVRVGVTEQGGAVRLNQVLQIPVLVEQTASGTGTEGRRR